MKGRMKAAILYKPFDMRLEEMEIPEIGPNEVLVKIQAVGICGSDIHFYRTGRCGTFVVKEPLVLGHESAGEIVEVGENVTNIKKGDRVAIEPGFPCGRCYFCKIGKYNLCPNVKFYGAPPIHGAFREYAPADAAFVYKLPPNLSYEEGALIEPLAVGMQGVRRCNLEDGSVIAVFGCGPVGLLTMQAAKASGAATAIAVDILDYRLEVAEKLGADHVVNAAKEDVSKKISSLTDGRGADVVFEVSGATKAFEDALRVVRPGGVIVQIGIFEAEEIPLRPALLIDKELDIRGVFRYANAYEPAIRLAAAGKVQLKPLITHTFPLDRIHEAFKVVMEKIGNPIKVIIKP